MKSLAKAIEKVKNKQVFRLSKKAEPSILPSQMQAALGQALEFKDSLFADQQNVYRLACIILACITNRSPVFYMGSRSLASITTGKKRMSEGAYGVFVQWAIAEGHVVELCPAQKGDESNRGLNISACYILLGDLGEGVRSVCSLSLDDIDAHQTMAFAELDRMRSQRIGKPVAQTPTPSNTEPAPVPKNIPPSRTNSPHVIQQQQLPAAAYLGGSIDQSIWLQFDHNQKTMWLDGAEWAREEVIQRYHDRFVGSNKNAPATPFTALWPVLGEYTFTSQVEEVM